MVTPRTERKEGGQRRARSTRREREREKEERTSHEVRDELRRRQDDPSVENRETQKGLNAHESRVSTREQKGETEKKTNRNYRQPIRISVPSPSSDIPSEHAHDESDSSSSHTQNEVGDHVPSEKPKPCLRHDLKEGKDRKSAEAKDASLRSPRSPPPARANLGATASYSPMPKVPCLRTSTRKERRRVRRESTKTRLVVADFASYSLS